LTRSPEAQNFVEGIRKAAQLSSIWVSVGVHEPPGAHHDASESKQRCFNTQLLINSEGDILARYRKTHLFDVDIKGGLTILESETTIPGTALESPISSPIGKVGVRTVSGHLVCGMKCSPFTPLTSRYRKVTASHMLRPPFSGTFSPAPKTRGRRSHLSERLYCPDRCGTLGSTAKG
jgi:hypothetical protein